MSRRYRSECLSREMLLNLREARVVIADWRQHYNRERPHSRPGYLSPEGFIQTKILTHLLGQLLGPAQSGFLVNRAFPRQM